LVHVRADEEKDQSCLDQPGALRGIGLGPEVGRHPRREGADIAREAGAARSMADSIGAAGHGRIAALAMRRTASSHPRRVFLATVGRAPPAAARVQGLSATWR